MPAINAGIFVWKLKMVLLIGIFASACSMISFLPQAWKIICTHDTKSISAPMYVITVLGFAAWLAFGILKDEWKYNGLIISDYGAVGETMNHGTSSNARDAAQQCLDRQ